MVQPIFAGRRRLKSRLPTFVPALIIARNPPHRNPISWFHPLILMQIQQTHCNKIIGIISIMPLITIMHIIAIKKLRTVYWMMWHALPGKGGISIEQSKQWRAFCIYKTWALKYHARIGQVKGTIIWVKDWCARLESCVQLAIILQLCDRSFHGINWISPVKIKNLLSIQLWRAAWSRRDAASEVKRKGKGWAVVHYLLQTIV